MGTRLKVLLLVLLTVVLMSGFLLISPKGPVTIDEGIYHLMVHNLVFGDGLFVWNGYEEFPSRELTLRFLSPYEGRLSGQYPFLYAILNAPFYALFGTNGLFIPNILGFGATILFTFILARQLFDDEHLALTAALVLLLATFLVEYGPGIWPHASTVALGTGAFCSVVRGARSQGATGSWFFSGLGGLALGLAIGLRFDAVLLTMGLVVALLGLGDSRLKRSLAFAVGLAPPLLVLTVVNGIRFGTWFPITYGLEGVSRNVSGYVPLVAVAAVVLLGFLALTRPGALGLAAGHRTRVVGAGAAALVILLTLPGPRVILLDLLRGAWVLVVDLREYSGVRLERAPGGSLLYYGRHKKALLQSCPYLVALAVPLWSLFREERRRLEILTLLAAIVPVIGLFASREWHGGFSFNTRYFLGALPFAAILTAIGLRKLGRGISRPNSRKLFAAALLGGALAFLIGISPPVMLGGGVSEEMREHLVMSTPLVIAAALLGVLLLWLWRGRPVGGWTHGLSVALMAAGLTWAWSAAYASDLLWSQAIRSQHERLSAASEPVLEPNSILFSSVPHPFSGLTARRVRLAHPLSDEYADFLPLIRYHLGAGRPVYVLWWDLEQFCQMGGTWPAAYATVPVVRKDGTTIVEVRPAPHRSVAGDGPLGGPPCSEIG